MFPPGVAEAFEREYGSTEAEWLQSLPGAVAGHALQVGAPGQAQVALVEGRLHLRWSVLAPRQIALMRMPRLLVGFRFEGVDPAARQGFMRFFDLSLQRGGG